MTKTITDATLNDFVNSARPGQTSLIYFWGEECGPCKQLSPAVDKLAAEHPDVNVGKINAGQNTASAIQHGVLALPVIVAYRDGQIVDEARQNITRKHLARLANI